MSLKNLADRMKKREFIHVHQMPQGLWAVLRLDMQRGAHLKRQHFQAPFDERFTEYLLDAAQAVLTEFQGCYAYVAKDEISILFPPTWGLYNRNFRKVMSLGAARASATFSLAYGQPVTFNSIGWFGNNAEDVTDYFQWQQAEATRYALHEWAYYTLSQAGLSRQEITQALDKQSGKQQYELLLQHGLNFAKTAGWQRKGIGLYTEQYTKEGFNPRTQHVTQAKRTRLKVDRELPTGAKYTALLLRLIDQYQNVKSLPVTPQRYGSKAWAAAKAQQPTTASQPAPPTPSAPLTRPVTVSILRKVTEADYLHGETTGTLKREYGSGFVAPLPLQNSNNHRIVTLNIITALYRPARAQGCQVYTSDLRVRVAHGPYYYYPDVLVTCEDVPDDAHYAQSPCLIVEVLSDSTRATDLGDKVQAYCSLPSLQGYLLVDTAARAARLYTRRADGWQESYCEGTGVLQLSCIDLALTLDEVYEGTQL